MGQNRPRQDTRPSLDQVNADLADQVVALCGIVLSNGHRDGHVWRCGDIANTPPRTGGGGGSLVVWLDGPRKGWWKDFACMDKARDSLELVCQGLCGGNKRQAIQWAYQFLGYRVHDKGFLRDLHDRHAERSRQAAKQERVAREDSKRRSRQAQAMWLAADDRIAETPVAAYLAGRGIDLARLGRVPRALRFAADCHNMETDTKLPAMVAAICDGRGRHVATHRTWLAQVDGKWVKADLKKAKMVLGDYAGASIRLWRGTTHDPDTGEIKPAAALKDAPAGSLVTISEGIEDGLSVPMMRPDRRVIAAISLSNMGHVWLPDTIKGATILGQNEDKNQAVAQRNAQVAALQDRGISARLFLPPPDFKDINAWLQATIGSGN